VFFVIALMVLIWSSIVMVELRNPWVSADRELRAAMISALCCVVPFLCEYVTNATTPFIYLVDIEMFSHRL